jgi:hypothetical protein
MWQPETIRSMKMKNGKSVTQPEEWLYQRGFNFPIEGIPKIELVRSVRAS